MLLNRSILLEVCLFLVVTQVKCQNYDYAVDEGEDHADFQDEAEESDHPDYSKYYSVDNSAPLITQNAPQNTENSGFVNPIEFSSFFSPSTIAFGASNNQEVTKQTNGFIPKDSKLDPFDSLKQEFPEFYANGPYPKDYFEESQKQQQQQQQEEHEEEKEGSPSDIRPGPNYISHQVPVQYNSDEDRYRGSNSDEVETIPAKPNKKHKSRKHDKKKSKDHDESPDYPYEPRVNYNKYNTDYNTGKSSSTVSQYPTAAGFPEKYTQAPTTTLSPYQKYSFQSVGDNEGLKPNYLDTLISTVAPFNPNYNKLAKADPTPVFESQSSENIPSNLKECRKIKKAVSEEESMNCYVCDDPSTKSKFTQCSYTSEPEPVSHYSGTSERYSTPSKGPDGFRYKRYTNDDSYNDPYTYIKKRSQKIYSEPSEAEKYKDDFQYSPDYYTEETEPEKSYSEQQSEEIKKNPQNCKKVAKDGMTCTICKNAKTGGNYEQCSYTSEPKEQKYAYITEKKYDSEEPEESNPVAQTKKFDQKPKSSNQEFGKKITSRDYEPIEEYEGRRKNNKRPERQDNTSSRRRNEEGKKKEVDGDVYHRLESNKPQQFKNEKTKKNSRFDDDHQHFEDKYHHGSSKKAPKNSKPLINDDPYEVPQHFAESTAKERKHGGRGLDPALYGNADSSENVETTEKSNEYKDIDEYHFKLFPEFANSESRQEQTQQEYPLETSKQDVEEVLAEFTKKDRSQCKKAERNGMTCYLCVDKNKIQHEECMYVSESKPKSTHVAYHEVQQFKDPEKEDDTDTKGTEQASPAVAESKRKRFFKKVSTTPTPEGLEQSASEEIDTIVEFRPKKISPKQKRNSKKSKGLKTATSQRNSERLDDSAEPTLKTPSEFVVADEEGAYSAETKPVYSKVLGVKLPKYMIEKSEFEKEFDDFSGSF